MGRIVFPIGHVVRVALLMLLSVIFGASSLAARDVFVVLSGGVSPFENNYSQYLQARALNAYLERRYPRDSVWTFFGAGNVEGEQPAIADVRRKVQREGLTIDSWLPGLLPHNRPAKREVILRALREEILPAVANGGTLYLFVGDHGSRPSGRDGESQIDLWQLNRDPRSERSWRSERNAALGVAELRRTLVSGIGNGRVVFCMTQCHAGGFHYLAIPREPSPNPKWFTQVPAWAFSKQATVFPRVAGFTATDEFSAAAGCDPNPNSDHWAGYERFLPEQLLGLDLFTLRPTGNGQRSIAEAHVAATLQDETIDKPFSTSEEFLERWASLLETRLARETNLTAKVMRALAAYRRTVDGVASPVASDAAFRERQTQFRHFIEKMSAQNPGASGLLLAGTRLQLEDAIGTTRRSNPAEPTRDRGKEPQRPQRRPRGPGGSGEARTVWKETIQPAWKAAVETDTVTNLTPVARAFEKHLLQLEEKKEKYFFSGGSALEEEVFWYSGYGDPQTLDQARAESVAGWSLQRRAQILAWASAAGDANVREAAGKISRRPFRRQVESASPRPSEESRDRLSKKTAAERTLFYRRALAAWEFLLAVNERPALARLRELTELERTPFPQGNQ